MQKCSKLSFSGKTILTGLSAFSSRGERGGPKRGPALRAPAGPGDSVDREGAGRRKYSWPFPKPPGFGPLISATQLSNSTRLNSPLFRQGFGTGLEGSPIGMCKRGATDPPASYRTQKIGKIGNLSRLCQPVALLQPFS